MPRFQWSWKGTRGGFYLGVAWSTLATAPFALNGESWGMVWYYLALPASALAKPAWDVFGPFVYVATASAVNTLLLMALAGLAGGFSSPPGSTDRPDLDSDHSKPPTPPPYSSPMEPNPTIALTSYLQELRSSSLPRYERSSQQLARVEGLALAVAGLIGLSVLTSGPTSPTVLVGFFAIVIAAQAMMLALRRESGRSRLTELIANAEVASGAVTSPTARTEIHQTLIKNVHRVEQEQAWGAWWLVPWTRAKEVPSANAQ